MKGCVKMYMYTVYKGEERLPGSLRAAVTVGDSQDMS